VKALHKNKVSEVFMLAQYWYENDINCDVTIRCSDLHFSEFRCHRLIIRDLINYEYGTDLYELDDVDQLIIPDLTSKQLQAYIRVLYGFEEESYDISIKTEQQDFNVKVKIEEVDEEYIGEDFNSEPTVWKTDPISVDHFMNTKDESLDKEVVKKEKILQIFSCELCERCFTDKYKLKRHMLVHSDESGFKCCIITCESAFKRRDALLKHYKNVHTSKDEQELIEIKLHEENALNAEKNLEKKKASKERQKERKKDRKKLEVGVSCQFCAKVFHRQDHLTRHLLAHTGERPHKCDICLADFTRKDKLNYHLKKAHREVIFLCHCSKIFISEVEFDQHIQSNPDHYEEELPIPELKKQDDVIGEESVNENKIEGESGDMNIDDDSSVPIKNENQDNISSDINKLASDTLFDENEPAKNKKIVKKAKKKEKVKDGVEIYQCSYCPETFISIKDRKSHYLSFHYDILKSSGLLFKNKKVLGIKNSFCTEEGCGKAFRNKSEVQDHINVVHKKIKNFICHLCSHPFPYKKNLRLHMALKHDDTNENIMCPKCGDVFGSKIKLSAHMAYKHRKNVKILQCSYCDYKTHQTGYMKIHERAHRGEKPEICQWCGSGFNCKKTLKDHERLHTGEKPFVCPVCEKGYAQRSNLRLHVRSSHKLELKDIEEKKPKYLGKYNSNTGNENQTNTIGKYNSNTGNENQTNTIELPNIATTENLENSEHKATSSTTVLFPSILRTLPYLKGPFDSA